jgi:alpha-mannosidase
MFPTFKQRIDSLNTRLRLIAQHVVIDSEPLAPLELRLGDSTVWQPVPPGTYWGTWQTPFEMRGAYTIPPRFGARDALALLLPIGDSGDFEHPEALVYIDGVPVSGVDNKHGRITLGRAQRRRGKRTLRLVGWTGLGGSLDRDMRQKLYMGQPALAVIDRALEQFIALARTVSEAIAVLDDLRPEKYALLTALEEAFTILDTSPPFVGLRSTTASAHRHLDGALKAIGVPHPLTLHGVGHAHIDTAWLWTTAVTRGKVERTFHTALHLMDEYPGYVFAASQPQLYDWFRAAHPDSFARLTEQVKAKRWEPLGGMWVEPDLNVTGAESLVRQFMLGRRFFEGHFGADAETPVLWLPDTFGFPGSIPQLAVQAGMRWFFTIKMRWNEVNEFPHDTFWWQGIDGSRLLAHMSTVPWMGRLTDIATYNADPRPSSAVHAWVKQKDKRGRDVLLAYGWGDGGGGPTREMLDSMAVLKEFPAMPRHIQTRARDFYTLLEKREGVSAPTWDGEMLLETHQGTLTSQARIKRLNRAAEKRLHTLEFLAAFASVHVPGSTYPRAVIDAAWETVCLHQFHDILPGSSIDAVYEDAERDFAALFNTLDAATAAVRAALSRHFGGTILINLVDARRTESLMLTGTGERVRVALDGFSMARPVHTPTEDRVMATPFTLENAHIRAVFDMSGELNSLFDKVAQRELIAPSGGGGALVAYEDRPAMFDAWNIDAPLLMQPIARLEGDSAPEVVESEGSRATLRFDRRILGSDVSMHITLEAGSPRLMYETTIDWQQAYVLLRAEFPLNIHARTADHGIQWGHVTRPTHSNTTWDAAQYETPHHGWIAVRDGAYGVLLLDDGIYGGSVRQGRTEDGAVVNTVALTLIKRASTPAPFGDAGSRTLRYAITPLPAELPARAALRFAYAPIALHRADAPERPLPPALVRAGEGVIIQTIKRAEDDHGLIVRLYEARGGAASTAITFGFDVASVVRTDIMERPGTPLTVEADGRTVRLSARAFEIITLRVVPAAEIVQE